MMLSFNFSKKTHGAGSPDAQRVMTREHRVIRLMNMQKDFVF